MTIPRPWEFDLLANRRLGTPAMNWHPDYGARNIGRLQNTARRRAELIANPELIKEIQQKKMNTDGR